MQNIPRFLGKFAMIMVAALAFNATVIPAAQAGSHAPCRLSADVPQEPERPGVQGRRRSKVKVTGDVMATLKLVNAHVNRTIKPKYDSTGADVERIRQLGRLRRLRSGQAPCLDQGRYPAGRCASPTSRPVAAKVTPSSSSRRAARIWCSTTSPPRSSR